MYQFIDRVLKSTQASALVLDKLALLVLLTNRFQYIPFQYIPRVLAVLVGVDDVRQHQHALGWSGSCPAYTYYKYTHRGGIPGLPGVGGNQERSTCRRTRARSTYKGTHTQHTQHTYKYDLHDAKAHAHAHDAAHVQVQGHAHAAHAAHVQVRPA